MIKVRLSRIGLVTLILTTSAHATADQLKPLKSSNSLFDENCIEPDSNIEKLCDISTDSGIPVFSAPPVIPDAIQLDVRPENCESFFDDYIHTRRGLRIESALGISTFYQEYKETVSNFPIVDFLTNGHVRVVKTRDLLVNSFNNSSNDESLFEQILKDAEDVNDQLLNELLENGEISATSKGVTTTISADDVQQITLDIVIQSGIATASQIDQLNRAKAELKSRWGFELQVIEIP